MAKRRYNPICQLNGCTEPHYSKGWCRRHGEQASRGKEPRLETSEYTEQQGTCAAADCDNSFRQRSAGSVRLYCSRKCADRTAKAVDRARPDYVPPHRRPGRKPCVVDGCELPSFTWKMCVMHYNRAVKNDGDPGEAASRRCGRGAAEWRVNREGYLRRSFNGEIQLQHRWVMEEHLGRRLWPDETVHHKNGDRADNRLDNLELWSKSQPAGQRVEDKVAWAKEILARYGLEPNA